MPDVEQRDQPSATESPTGVDGDATVPCSDGAVLRVSDHGTGPPVVLLHGALGSIRDWDLVSERLSGDPVRLVAYDQRGHGRSTAGEEGFSVERYGRDLETVMDHLDLTGAVVVGHSMGGMAILAYLASSPTWRSRLSGVVLVSTSAVGLGDWKHRLLAPAVAAGFLQWALARPALGRAFLRQQFGASVDPALVERARSLVAATPPLALRRAPLSVMEFDLTPSLPSIDVPTRILVGTRDRSTTVEAAASMCQLIPHAILEVLPHAGHFLNYERPDDIATTIRAALTAVP